MKMTAAVLILAFAAAFGQDEPLDPLRGLRVYGASEAGLPIVRLRSNSMTVEFDILSEDLPDIQMRFVHCDRNWTPTPTSFVNDDFRNKTKSAFTADPSPTGVVGYTYHYKITIPGYPHFDGFQYSGNYFLEIWDVEKNAMLAREKFFVVDEALRVRMRVLNRQEPSAVNPYYQVHEVRVAFAIPGPDSTGSSQYDVMNFSDVDIYKNREIGRPRRISSNDSDPHTFVQGYGTPQLEFVLDNMEPGSEYRVLDLRNTDFYPPGKSARSKDGADLSRFLGKVGPDHDGASSIVRGTSYSDYLDYRFELLWKSGGDPVYVVGDFNNWTPGASDRMTFETDRFVWTTSLRRGIYDYQYVLGDDWTVLEGNSWQTTNNYTALVYYRDPRFGGFDRIVGIARGRSPGGTSRTN